MKTVKRRDILGGFLGLSALSMLDRLPRGPVAKLKPLPIAKAKPAAQSIEYIWRGVSQQAVGPNRPHHCPYCCSVWKFAGSIGNGWWYDWLPGGPRTCLNPSCGQTYTAAQFWTYVSMSYSGGDISNVVQYRPAGSYYMIFNQPDDPWQANKDPVQAAFDYWHCYQYIKQQDPTARVGGIGLGFVDANGWCTTSQWSIDHGGADYFVPFLGMLQTLNRNCPDPAKARFDFYHVHGYFMPWLPEWRRGPAASSDGITVTFKRLKKHLQWLRGSLHDQYPHIIPADVPVWISEVSRLTTSEYLNLQLQDILVTWLQAGQGTDWVVQKVAWFVTRIEDWMSGCSLFQPNLQDFTAVGKAWENLV